MPKNKELQLSIEGTFPRDYILPTTDDTIGDENKEKKGETK